MASFYGLGFSPWSIKSRWALSYHDTPHMPKPVSRAVTPWVIRCRTGSPNGRVTFPVLFTEDGSAFTESFDIAKWSSENPGPDSKGDLFADFDLEQLKAWNAKADEIMCYGRTQVFDKVLVDKDAVKMPLPGFLQSLGPITTMLGRSAMQGMRKKYINEPGATDADKARANLVALREALKGGKQYILGKFSYADVAMVVSLQMVKPGSNMPLPPILHDKFTVPALAEDFPDLLEWRDKISKKHFTDTVAA